MQKHTIDISTEIILKVVAVGLGLWFLYLIRDVLALFFVAFIVMAAIDPLVTWFNGKVKIPRGVGVLIIYIFLITFLVLTISYLAPELSKQFGEFNDEIPKNSEKIGEFVNGIVEYGQSLGLDLNKKDVLDKISSGFDASSSIFSTTVGFVAGLASFVVVFAMAFYMSIKPDGMEKFLHSVTPDQYEEKTLRIAKKIKNRIGKWMGGQLVLMGVIFLLNYLVLSFLDIPYALTIALIGGFLEIIPYIGPTLSTILAVTVSLLVSPVKAVFVLIGYIVIQQAENHILLPQIMKKAVGLNPLSVIMAMLIGVKLAGAIGVILAVPVATAVGVIIKELMNKEKEVKVTEGQPQLLK